MCCKTLGILLVGLTVMGCGLDVAGNSDCKPVDVASNVAGKWSGTLGGNELTLDMTEQCEAGLGTIVGQTSASPDMWHARGTWTWGGLTGWINGTRNSTTNEFAIGMTPADAVGLELAFGVVLRISAEQIPPGQTMTAIASHSWRMHGDTTKILASFDNAVVILRRR